MALHTFGDFGLIGKGLDGEGGFDVDAELVVGFGVLGAHFGHLFADESIFGADDAEDAPAGGGEVVDHAAEYDVGGLEIGMVLGADFLIHFFIFAGEADQGGVEAVAEAVVFRDGFTGF